MTIFHVDKTGTGGAELTITSAINKAAAGDTLIVHDGSYHESIAVAKPLTIKAADGEEPEVDGWYDAANFGKKTLVGYDGKPTQDGCLPSPVAANVTKEGWLPAAVVSNTYAPLVNITAPGVVWDGIDVRNSPGRGLQITYASDVLISNTHVDFCYAGCLFTTGLDATKRITGIVFDNCTATRGSLRAWDKTRPGASGNAVDSCVIFRFCDGPIFQYGAVAFNFGEGIWLGNGTIKAQVRGNNIHTNLHVGGYPNGGGTYAEFIENYFYWCENLLDMMQACGLPAFDNALFGDEEITAQSGPGLVFRGNVVVGGPAAAALAIEGWNGSGAFPRPFVLDNAKISKNTVWGHFRNNRAVLFGSSTHRAHVNSVIENNIFLQGGAPELASAMTYGQGYSGVVCGHNLSNTPLPLPVRGAGDVVTVEQVLLDPGKPITGVFDVYSTDKPDPYNNTFDVDNYRPLANGPAIGRASDGGTIGALEPPLTDPDPAPDVDAAVSTLDDALTQLDAAMEAVKAAVAEVEANQPIVTAAMQALKEAIDEQE